MSSNYHDQTDLRKLKKKYCSMCHLCRSILCSALTSCCLTNSIEYLLIWQLRTPGGTDMLGVVCKTVCVIYAAHFISIDQLINIFIRALGFVFIFFLNGTLLFIQSTLNCQISISSSCYFEFILNNLFQDHPIFLW